MVQEMQNGSAKKPPIKPSGIRIVHQANKPAAVASPKKAAATNGHPVSPPPRKKTGDEIWGELLAEAEGDVPTAVSTLNERIAQGNLQVASGVAAMADYLGARALDEYKVHIAIAAALEQPDGHPARHAALEACAGLANMHCKPVEPHLMALLPAMLSCFSDKSAATREAAAATGAAIVDSLNPHATRAVVEVLLGSIKNASKWQVRVGSLGMLEARAKRCPAETGHCMLDIMPVLSSTVVDTRPEVAAAASTSLLACIYTAGNRDLEPCVPAIVSCTARPAEVADTVAKLSATTFVQAMEDACLAVLVPLMQRALRERSAKTQRRAAVIIENMGKLVLNPADARPFLPALIPELDKVAENAADPELREVAGRARDALLRIKAADEELEQAAGHAATVEEVRRAVTQITATAAPSVDLKSGPVESTLSYVAALGASLIASHIRGPRSWEGCSGPYLATVLGDDKVGAEAALALRRWALTHMGEVVAEEEELEDELCNCEFSLAYGGRILLTNTVLRLRRGRRYGLCGANGAGKSTLMRAISNGQLDGFPPADELRTVYVEHDIDSSESETTVADYIFDDKVVQEAVAPSREDVERTLSSVGFSLELQSSPLRSLSGGWKMKLALARAMLIKADILLLDEPTNHLDTTNVAWLENYLTSMPDVSSMIVSHDSGFLDNVCTDIIHYETRKLVHYPGNLSEFVKVKPEAQTYYELSAAAFKFKFPEPGFLDGIKGKRQPVMRTQNMGFTYPGAAKPQLTDATVRVSLGSRVAVLGRNGAGKSTLIKVLTGETTPTEGTCWRHPNLRIAYVAQHAFHHIEDHLEKTPSQYFWWRFGDGEDREAKEKATRKFTREEIKAREAAIARGDRVVEELNSRRMGSKTKEYEYEIKWLGQSFRENTWVGRTEMIEKMGLGKLVEEMDNRIASLRLYRALSKDLVISHLKDFGLEEEIAAHNMIRGLSGGQKVKLVLAAAMWCQPHMLVLDEPTNYLDRDSLGALAAGIQEFNGGVIMISHNNEFTSALCHEEWQVGDGKVVVQGQLMPEVASMASLATCSSVASLSTLGGGDSDADLADLDPEALEAALKEKTSKRAEKERIAAEKAAKKAEKAKLRFARKF